MQNSLGRWFSDRQTCSLSLCSALESHSPSFTSCVCSALSGRKYITKGNNTSSELLTTPPAKCCLCPLMPPLPKHMEGPSKRREAANRGLSVQFAERCSTTSRGWKMKMFFLFCFVFGWDTHTATSCRNEDSVQVFCDKCSNCYGASQKLQFASN